MVIVGTGAGGATAARVLAEAGLSVVLLEEGPRLANKALHGTLFTALATRMRDFGTQTTIGSVRMPVLQGVMVGGSTAINSGIIWRMPDATRAEWAATYGLQDLLDERELDRAFSHIERELDVRRVESGVLGENSRRMAEGARALGLSGRMMLRNAAHCEGSAQCLIGCPTGARQSMDQSYVPRAIASGARLHARTRALKVLVERGRAIGVMAEHGPATRRSRILLRARRAVILAAGAVHTPWLLHRTGLRGAVGRGFMAHPGAAVLGRFDDPIQMGRGATQGYEVPLPERSFKLESLAMPPDMLASRIPGAGAEWQARLQDLDHYAHWVAILKMQARGRVRVGFGGRPVIEYEPLPIDVERAREAMTVLCEMFFAAGAREVYPGIARVPATLTSAQQIDALRGATLEARDFHFIISHIFGGACVGLDTNRSVVGSDLQCHAVPGLYVMDASVFPSNLGVNPQHSIMGVTWRAAERLANARAVRALWA